MAKLADAIAANTRHKGPACAVSVAAGKLGKPDSADLDQALADPIIGGAALARGLAAITGVKVPAPAVLKHRKGECGCAI